VISAIIGKKIGMTTIFDEKGLTVPVTLIEAGPVTVIQVRTLERDGYSAVQLGFGEKKLQRANKPELGHAKKAGTSPKRVLKELRVEADKVAGFSLGQVIKLADVGFAKGDFVDVIGTSIGKGMAGVMKRYHFHGYDAGHGTHEYKRHGGSIGTNTTPGRTLKGKKMPGHLGNARATVMSLKVADVRPDENLILIRGAVPGHDNSIVVVRVAKKKKAKKAPEKAA